MQRVVFWKKESFKKTTVSTQVRSAFKLKHCLELIHRGQNNMITKTYPTGELKKYKYVVTLSSYKGKILLSRHKERTTWETQGGHIEEGETPLEAAKRELYEESGATDYYIAPLCDYWAGTGDESDGANGMVFKAVIHQLGAIPHSEMAEVKTFDALPDNLTYPAITPVLFGYLGDNAGALTIPMAKMILEEAHSCNPGQWKQHSEYVAGAAKMIAGECEGLDPEKAYVLGLLHDIGRRFGVSHLAHVYDGYHYLKELGYDDAARIALTHSFHFGRLEDYIGNFDISEEKQRELASLLADISFHDYDYLIQLCDSIAKADGIVTLEERMTDVKDRYGCYPQEKWDRNMELKQYFENKMRKDLYQVVNVDHCNSSDNP